MKTYRVPVEFQAENDEHARKIATGLTIGELTGTRASGVRIKFDELVWEYRSWFAVPEPEETL